MYRKIWTQLTDLVIVYQTQTKFPKDILLDK